MSGVYHNTTSIFDVDYTRLIRCIQHRLFSSANYTGTSSPDSNRLSDTILEVLATFILWFQRVS